MNAVAPIDKRRWTLDDIDWARFDASKVTPDLLKVVKTAAMVERNGGDYAKYLCSVFEGDESFCSVARSWAIEEEQHGLALGKWAELADSSFSLDQSFKTFTSIYQIPTDVSESVRGSRLGELCARCIVETGTSSFYSAIRDAIDEPVLKQICAKIAADEFAHYKLFYTHLERYLKPGFATRWERLKVAITRFRETSDDEIASAYYAGNGAQGPYNREEANAAYGERTFAFYQHRHVRRAGFMFAQAAGLNPEGWAAKLLTKVLWLVIWHRGRKFRPALTPSAA